MNIPPYIEGRSGGGSQIQGEAGWLKELLARQVIRFAGPEKAQFPAGRITCLRLCVRARLSEGGLELLDPGVAFPRPRVPQQTLSDVSNPAGCLIPPRREAKSRRTIDWHKQPNDEGDF